MRTIHVTKLQSEELQHKLTIVRDERDLLDSYEVTEDEVQALLDALPQAEGEFAFEEKYVDLFVGESENLIDIAESNLDRCNDSELAQMRGYISSIRGLIRKFNGNDA